MIKILFLFSFSLLCAIPVSAQEKESPKTIKYDSFKIIWERNIFQPNRQPISARELVKDPTPVFVQADTISLVGSLLNENESFAFFSGTKPEYQAVVIKGGTIAEYRVASIRTDGVKLEKNQESIDLPVGMGLKKGDDGKWVITTVFKPSPSSGSMAPAAKMDNRDSPSGSNDTASKSGSSDTSDILKKLMEKRAKELKK